ncbi:MAG: hypothetical protein ACI8PT_000884 [Gammaproteobacteria bacterium]|jgi:hypothetical protein
MNTAPVRLVGVLSIVPFVLALAFAPRGYAERIAIESVTQLSNTARPHRGMSHADVQGRFGLPTGRVAPVGEPPISRWTYPKFIVYFEHDRVIHTVVKR